VLGCSGVEVSAIGLGAWAIGGPFSANGQEAGWGEVDDEESIAAVRQALDLGVTLIDTADTYGAGHSERVLGRALAGRPDEVVIATKFGNTFDEATRTRIGTDVSAGYIRAAC
jgi:aryl-alcohol dehydrogenase-like predicted oxidoreductase